MEEGATVKTQTRTPRWRKIQTRTRTTETAQKEESEGGHQYRTPYLGVPGMYSGGSGMSEVVWDAWPDTPCPYADRRRGPRWTAQS